MNPKLTTIDTKSEPVSKPTPARPKRRIRRQIDLGHVTGAGESFLLSHEDPDALQTLRQSIQDKLGANSPAELVMAEFATADAWRGLRAHRLFSACVDTEVQESAEAVDREYEEIDPTSRTALVFYDANTARVVRLFEHTATQCHRILRQIFPMKAGNMRR